MKKLNALVLAWILTFMPIQSVAQVHIRSSSDNGMGTSVQNWKLLEYSGPQAYAANGKKVVIEREIICQEQDVDTGQCDSGEYLFLFQMQSVSTNVTVKIERLLPVYNDAGVMQCDANNDQELCTTDTNPPSLATLASSITATFNKSAGVATFVIPSFGSFPAGSTAEEGQGLTIYVQINQTPGAPLAYPGIGIS
jgi:hypothetical protein